MKFIGAINTILKRNQILQVYNTDWVAIYNLISKYSQEGKYVLIIGAGGTSLAAIYAVLQHHMIPIIFNRAESMEKTLKFVKEVNLKVQDTQVEFCPSFDLLSKNLDISHYKEASDLSDIQEFEAVKRESPYEISGVISCIPGTSGFTLPADIPLLAEKG